MLKVSILLAIVVALTTTVAEASARAKLLPISSLSSPSWKARDLDNTNFCRGCRSLMSLVSKFNSSNQRSDNKELLENFCELYYPVSTDFQQGPCPIFVASFYYLIDNIDPINHCDQIAACGSLFDVATSKQSTNLIIGSTSSSSSPSDGVVCDFCVNTLEQVQKSLTDKRTEETIRRRVNEFCNYLGMTQIKHDCKVFLNNHLDATIQFIKNLDVKNYCQVAGLCRPNVRRTIGNSIPTFADFNNFGIETSVTIGDRKQQQLNRGNSLCPICKEIMKEIVPFVNANSTEQFIKDQLDKVCSVVYPSSVDKRKDCEAMVNQYADQIVNIIVDEMDPETICMLLDLCVYETSAINKQTSEHQFNLGDLLFSLDKIVEPESEKACIECRLFIDYLRETMSNPKSREEVKEFLDKNLCQSITDAKLAKKCSQLVENYADFFFETLIGALDPHVACVEMGACKKSMSRLVLDLAPALTALQSPVMSSKLTNQPIPRNRNRNQVTQIKTQTGVLCDQCVDVVTAIDDYVSKHPIDQDVSVLVDQVCNKLPNELIKKQCKFMVVEYGAAIARAIATMDNPKQVCQSISMC